MNNEPDLGTTEDVKKHVDACYKDLTVECFQSYFYAQ